MTNRIINPEEFEDNVSAASATVSDTVQDYFNGLVVPEYLLRQLLNSAKMTFSVAASIAYENSVPEEVVNMCNEEINRSVEFCNDAYEDYFHGKVDQISMRQSFLESIVKSRVFFHKLIRKKAQFDGYIWERLQIHAGPFFHSTLDYAKQGWKKIGVDSQLVSFGQTLLNCVFEFSKESPKVITPKKPDKPLPVPEQVRFSQTIPKMPRENEQYFLRVFPPYRGGF